MTINTIDNNFLHHEIKLIICPVYLHVLLSLNEGSTHTVCIRNLDLTLKKVKEALWLFLCHV